jgi:hypothetical protein
MDRTVTISEERYRELLSIEDSFLKGNGMIKKVFDDITAVYESEASWESKYDRIFGGGLCKRFRELAPGFSWYDPDASYDDDVCAFYWAAEEYMNNL